MKAVVVGAGVIGAACARALAQAGIAVTVLERGAAASGTSAACEGNLLVSDKSPGPELELALFSTRRWGVVAAELADELGAGFPSIEYDRKGGLVVCCAAAGAAALQELGDRQRAGGVLVEQLHPADARVLEPDLTADVVAAAYYPQDAQLQPTAATEALLASARRAGAQVFTGEAVIGPRRRADGTLCGVATRSGGYDADIVVNCAGPWAGAVATSLGVELPVLPRRGMILVTTRMPPRIRHKVYGDDYVNATQSADAMLQTSTVVESTAAGTVLIGSSRERVGLDPRTDMAVAAQIARKAVALFPFLAETTVLRSYAGFRPYMPDHLPVIGPDSRLPGLYHVAGHEGAGIGLSIASADLLLAQVTGSSMPYDGAPFAVDRPSLAIHLQRAA